MAYLVAGRWPRSTGDAGFHLFASAARLRLIGMADHMTPQYVEFDWGWARMESRRNLPHVIQQGVIYYITMRLADSVPQAMLRQWARELEAWDRANPPPHTEAQREQYAELGYRRRERWLDRGEGCCVLRNRATRAEVEFCLGYGDGEGYWLGDFVIMPNHLHALLLLGGEESPKRTVGQWRSVSTHKVNRLLGRSGTLWQVEPFDHAIRDEMQLQRVRRYIRENGARLPCEWYTYSCGSLFGE